MSDQQLSKDERKELERQRQEAALKKKEEERKKKEEEKKAKEEEERKKKFEEERITWEEVKNETKLYGNYPIIQSTHTNNIEYTPVDQLNATLAGKTVTIRARIHTIRGKGKSCFILLRQGMFFVQATGFAGEGCSAELVKFAQKFTKETILDITAVVTPVTEEVKTATQKDIELHLRKIYCVSYAATPPISVDDAMRNEEDETVENQGEKGDRKQVSVSQDNRLNNRVIDLRAPAHIAIFRIQSAMGRFFREFLSERDFTEIHTPKLIAGASEGGADVFKVGYFNTTACLAQSPQLYKQMAVEGDLMRVFEIGPVFRAENSNTHRHLCEFVGMDLEMEIKSHYFEVMDTLDQMFVYIFNSIKKHFARELEAIREQYPFEDIKYETDKPNLRLSFPDAIKILREAGIPKGDMDDINTTEEKLLGKLVKEKYGTDFFMLDRFPMALRPFYTMPCPDDNNYSNSYDYFLRGEEILSGAQRIHDPKLLEEVARSKNVPTGPLQDYIDSFKYGAWPHGGAGVGLERVVMLYLGVGNIRKSSMFPRDPKRLTP